MAGMEFLFQENYRITDAIILRHPRVRNIIEIGEEAYFSIVRRLTDIPSDLKAPLFDAGIDYTQISDLEFFALMVKGLTSEEANILFPTIDITQFVLCQRDDGELILADKKTGAVIDMYVHRRLSDCLCQMHRIKKKVKKPGNETTKRILIDDDREMRERNRGKEFKSTLFPLISAMVNTAGFKYGYEDVQDLLFGQFMDAVARIQVIYSTDHLLRAIYNGTVDGKKVSDKKLDWTRPL